jgi:DNA-binding transcriptional ArsR family regulator
MSKYVDSGIDHYADVFKALPNPNRLKIFLRLRGWCPPGTVTSSDGEAALEGCACVGDLGQDLGIGASTISHHVKELRRADLIRMERRGQKMECAVDPSTLEAKLPSSFDESVRSLRKYP